MQGEENVNETVYGIVAKIMGVPAGAVTEDSSAASLQSWDSLRHMKLILAIEEAFGLQLTDEEIVSISDVRGILALLARKDGVNS